MLTENQKNNVQLVLNKKLEIEALTAPEERHQLTLHWNWDDGIEPLVWIINQPDTDLGTAVHIYWSASPQYWHKKQDWKSKYEKEMIDFVKNIEGKVESNFYTNKAINISPKPIDDKEILAYPIPKIMFNSTPGLIMGKEKLVTALIDRIRPVSNSELERIFERINRGIIYLKEFEKDIAPTDTPEKIIKAVQKVVYEFKGNSNKLSRKEKLQLDDLDFIFAEQINRKYGWKWYIHEKVDTTTRETNEIIVSANKEYYWDIFGDYISRFAGVVITYSIVEDGYKELSNAALAKRRKIFEKDLDEAQEQYPKVNRNELAKIARVYMEIVFLTSSVKDLSWN